MKKAIAKVIQSFWEEFDQITEGATHEDLEDAFEALQSECEIRRMANDEANQDE